MNDPLTLASRFPLTRVQAYILARLAQSPGMIVSYGALQDAAEAATGNRWMTDNIRTPVKLIRRAIKGKGQITSHYGMGYSLKWL